MTDESDQTFPFTINALLDNARSAPRATTARSTPTSTPTLPTEPESNALVASAQSHNVPIVSGKQMTSWLDGRNASSYSAIGWSANTLSFTVKVGTGATGLTGMVPHGRTERHPADRADPGRQRRRPTTT